MKRWPILAAAALVATVVGVRGQSPAGVPFSIERLDPALDEIITAGAAIETLGDRFALTEGALWVPEGQDDGYLLFSDNAANVIYKWKRNQPLSAFLEKSGFTGTDNFNTPVGDSTVIQVSTPRGYKAGSMFYRINNGSWFSIPREEISPRARKCTAVQCPLWPFRMGSNPFHGQAKQVAINPEADFLETALEPSPS